jgi:hypothetical protein
MTGRKADGTMGIYTSDEIKDWIRDKLNLTKGQARARGGSITSAISDFMSGKGKATSGTNKHVPHGAFRTPVVSHTSMYRGNPIYHASAGKSGAGDGMTIFYTNPQGRDGKIIGIGHHVDSTTYEIEWHVPDWHVGHTVTLS